MNWQKVGERLDEAIAQRKADLDAAFNEGRAAAEKKWEAARKAAEANENERTKRELPDGHVHTADGLDIDPVHGTDANPLASN